MPFLTRRLRTDSRRGHRRRCSPPGEQRWVPHSHRPSAGRQQPGESLLRPGRRLSTGGALMCLPEAWGMRLGHLFLDRRDWARKSTYTRPLRVPGEASQMANGLSTPLLANGKQTPPRSTLKRSATMGPTTKSPATPSRAPQASFKAIAQRQVQSSTRRHSRCRRFCLAACPPACLSATLLFRRSCHSG